MFWQILLGFMDHSFTRVHTDMYQWESKKPPSNADLGGGGGGVHPRSLGKWSNLTRLIFFQLDWNHHLSLRDCLNSFFRYFHSGITRVAGVKAKIYFAPWPKMRARAEKGTERLSDRAVENAKSSSTSHERGGALETRQWKKGSRCDQM